MLTNDEMLALLKLSMEKLVKLRQFKASEYTDGKDALSNFRRTAAHFNCSIEQVIMIFASKHWDTIVDYVNEIDSKTPRVRSEPIDGRIDDLISYLLILKGAIFEKERAFNDANRVVQAPTQAAPTVVARDGLRKEAAER